MLAARIAAAVLLPLLAAALAAPVHAQTERTLVSNTGQTHYLAGSTRVSQPFTTGSNARGYVLTSVGVSLFSGQTDDATDISVRIYSTRGDHRPKNLLYVLVNPSTIASDTLNTFTAPSGATLSANTTYAIVVSDSAGTGDVGIRVNSTASNDEDSGAADGWSIGNSRFYYDNLGFWIEDSGSSVRVKIRGTVTPNTAATGNPAISGSAQAGMTLTAGLGTIEDVNGVPAFPAGFTFEWIRYDGGRNTVIPGATSSTYTLTAADVGNTITVRVRFTDDGGESEGPFDSDPTPEVVQSDTTAPSVTGAVVSGTSLVIAFDEILAPAAKLANSAFAVKKTPSGGSEETVTLSGSPVIDGAAVKLALASAVASTDTVTVSYEKPPTDDANRLEDAYGNEVADFTGRPVTNTTGGPPVVSIAPVGTRAWYGTQAAEYRLTRLGSLTSGLDVSVTLSQDKPFLDFAQLARTVTIPAGSATQTLTVSAADLALPADVSVDRGTLTATVTDGAAYDVGTPGAASLDIVPYLTVRMDRMSYGVDEYAGTLDVKVIARTHGGPVPAEAYISVSTEAGDALPGEDYRSISRTLGFLSSDFVRDGGAWKAEKTVPLTIIDDAEVEPDERLALELEISPGLDFRVVLVRFDGTDPAGSPKIPVTIRDDETSREAAGRPSIVGVTNVDETVAVSTANVTDVDGKTKADNGEAGYAWTYRWYRVDADGVSNRTAIPGASAETYTLVEADAGGKIIVEVSFVDDLDNPEGPLESAAWPSGVIGDQATPLLEPVQPGEGSPSAVWSALLTVGSFDGDRLGYSEGVAGALSDRTFRISTPYLQKGRQFVAETTYAIGGAWYDQSDGTFTLVFTDGKFHDDSMHTSPLQVDLPGVGTVSFADATYNASTHGFSFPTGGAPDPPWLVGVRVRLQIVSAAEAEGPQNLVAEPAGSGDPMDIDLSWTAPSSGGTVTGYRVEWIPDLSLENWRVRVESQSATSYTDRLASGGWRWYRVAALRAGETPKYSAIVRAHATPSSVDPPLAPGYLEVRAVPGSGTALEARWPRVRGANGTNATHYTLQYAEDDGSHPSDVRRPGEDYGVTLERWMNGLTWTYARGTIEELELGERGPAALRSVIGGLTPGTDYRVRVRGCVDEDEIHCGGWSYPIKGTTSPGAAQLQNLEPLTVEIRDVPERHDGATAFTFLLAFSEDVAIDPAAMRDHALLVSGGTVTAASRVDGRGDLWEFTVQPSDSGAVSILVPADRACTETGALCTADGRKLSGAVPGQVVAGPLQEEQREPRATALTASFEDAPAAHDGSSVFTLELAFSEAVFDGSESFDKNRAIWDALQVSGGTVRGSHRADPGKYDRWILRIGPSGHGAVTVSLPVMTSGCGASGAICTPDGRALSGPVKVTVQGPPGLSVADATVEEGVGARLVFALTLSRAASRTVSVRIGTSDGSAIAGEDYVAKSKTKYFAPGETAKVFKVAVIDDNLDEGSEDLTVTLSNASGAYLAKATATGTIKNSDPMPQAWLARFGRTVGTHIADAVGDRLRSTPDQGSHLAIGGYRLPLGHTGNTAAPAGHETGPSAIEPGQMEGPVASEVLREVARFLGIGPGDTTGPERPVSDTPWLDRTGSVPRHKQHGALQFGDRFNLRQVLPGSTFRLNLYETEPAATTPRVAAWGRVAATRFDGRDGAFRVDGDVITGTVGVDGEWDRWLTGVAVAHSRGDGSYATQGLAATGRGAVDQSLTSIHPYMRYAVNERLDVWGVFGYGWGELTLTPAGAAVLQTDANLMMGAFGGRGILLPAADTGAIQLATRTDAMLTRTTSDAVTGQAGNLAASEADAHRLRVILEGSRGFEWAEGRRLTPTVELGLRHDRGDAETGFGLEVGGRVQYADPVRGLTVEGTVRGLLAHEDGNYREWGASGRLQVSRGPGGRGLSLTLAPAWGAASSGVEALWSRQTTAGIAPQTPRQSRSGRLATEVGYGVAAFDRGLLTPYAGSELAEGAAQRYRVGARLQLARDATTGPTLSLEGRRHDPAGPQPVNQGLRLQVQWRF